MSHIHDLVALALGATRDAAETAKDARPARRAAAPTSTPAPDASSRFGSTIPISRCGEIAHRLGVSPRLLQKIFAERGETVMARLWEERVNRAARLLSAPDGG